MARVDGYADARERDHDRERDEHEQYYSLHNRDGKRNKSERRLRDRKHSRNKKTTKKKRHKHSSDPHLSKAFDARNPSRHRKKANKANKKLKNRYTNHHSDSRHGSGGSGGHSPIKMKSKTSNHSQKKKKKRPKNTGGIRSRATSHRHSIEYTEAAADDDHGQRTRARTQTHQQQHKTPKTKSKTKAKESHTKPRAQKHNHHKPQIKKSNSEFIYLEDDDDDDDDDKEDDDYKIDGKVRMNLKQKLKSSSKKKKKKNAHRKSNSSSIISFKQLQNSSTSPTSVEWPGQKPETLDEIESSSSVSSSSSSSSTSHDSTPEMKLPAMIGASKSHHTTSITTADTTDTTDATDATDTAANNPSYNNTTHSGHDRSRNKNRVLDGHEPKNKTKSKHKHKHHMGPALLARQQRRQRQRDRGHGQAHGHQTPLTPLTPVNPSNEFLHRRPVSGMRFIIEAKYKKLLLTQQKKKKKKKKNKMSKRTHNNNGEPDDDDSAGDTTTTTDGRRQMRNRNLKCDYEFPKSAAVHAFLHACLLKEVLFLGMVDEIIAVMYRVECPAHECIIRQNEYGDRYFVIESGAFDIIHQELNGSAPKKVGQMSSGKAFGEGSLLYSIPRAATLKSTADSIVWALDARKFLEIRSRSTKKKKNETSKMVKYLKKIPLFKKYQTADLYQIAQTVQERKYLEGDVVVKQGDSASEFFLIKSGEAKAVIVHEQTSEASAVKRYTDYDYFGERGLFLQEVRAASVIATSILYVFVIKKSDFVALLSTDPLINKTFESQIAAYDDFAFEQGFGRRYKNQVEVGLAVLLAHNLGILGVGSFGRVSLVKDPTTNRTYSLKKVRKNKVIETGQQEHICNERAVLALLASAFCCRMYGTFQDAFNVYFLMEPILGGELFTILRWNKKFSEKTAKFYAACVVLAFEALHSKNILYRDLKPENLLIARNGYCKLVDFGFAKRRNDSCTLCGTPEYLSPEVIQGSIQSFTVDWWAFGIFVYEIIVGYAPFRDDRNNKMYEKIIKHEVQFPEEAQRKYSANVMDLILGLLRKNPLKRYGAGTDNNGTKQILQHPWFNGLDWKKMRQQSITPPHLPNIQNAEDGSNFDQYPEENIDEELFEDAEAYDWCQDF